MQKFHSKSLLLGVGIGIVVTSVISLVYTAGVDPTKDLTKEQVMKLAEKHNIVQKTPIIVQSSDPAKASPTPLPEIKKDSVVNQPKQTESPQEGKIVINEGDTSDIVIEKLYNAGIINDKASFDKELKIMNLEHKINIGEFKIKKGADHKEILNLIIIK